MLHGYFIRSRTHFIIKHLKKGLKKGQFIIFMGLDRDKEDE